MHMRLLKNSFIKLSTEDADTACAGGHAQHGIAGDPCCVCEHLMNLLRQSMASVLIRDHEQSCP